MTSWWYKMMSIGNARFSAYHIINVQDDRLVCHYWHQDVSLLSTFRPFSSSRPPERIRFGPNVVVSFRYEWWSAYYLKSQTIRVPLMFLILLHLTGFVQTGPNEAAAAADGRMNLPGVKMNRPKRLGCRRRRGVLPLLSKRENNSVLFKNVHLKD